MRIFLLLPLVISCAFCFGQDLVIMTNSDTLNVSVIKSSASEIEYTFPNEKTVNVMPKTKIFKIEYASGRVEVPAPNTLRATEPKNGVRRRVRWGLKVGANMPLISGLAHNVSNKINAMGGLSASLDFLETPSSFMFGGYINQMAAESTEGHLGINNVYLSIPLCYRHSFAGNGSIVFGVEPSVLLASEIYGFGDTYNTYNLSSNAVFGVTGGYRHFIVPKSWYIDIMGVFGVTNILGTVDSKPSKVNLSIGYNIRY